MRDGASRRGLAKKAGTMSQARAFPWLMVPAFFTKQWPVEDRPSRMGSLGVSVSLWRFWEAAQ